MPCNDKMGNSVMGGGGRGGRRRGGGGGGGGGDERFGGEGESLWYVFEWKYMMCFPVKFLRFVN